MDANTLALSLSTRPRPAAFPFRVYHQCAVLGNRSNEQWIARYASSHEHPVNRVCHTVGIPAIVLSLFVFLVSIYAHWLWPYALGLFLVGWAFQFIGHAFEHKRPEFFHDWRFLFVGVRWWWAKIQGKA
ncbi:MAG: Mpo1-like protein [Terriglobales bacterium]